MVDFSDSSILKSLTRAGARPVREPRGVGHPRQPWGVVVAPAAAHGGPPCALHLLPGAGRAAPRTQEQVSVCLQDFTTGTARSDVPLMMSETVKCVARVTFLREIRSLMLSADRAKATVLYGTHTQKSGSGSTVPTSPLDFRPHFPAPPFVALRKDIRCPRVILLICGKLVLVTVCAK
jgi:hypothetical protein